MAIIEQHVSKGGSGTGWDITELCPPGAHVAVCLDIKDNFDVTRPKYDDPSQNEVVNLTRFLFGVVGSDGTTYRIQTGDLKITGHEKSSLMKLLTGWLAKPLEDLIGWDYVEQKGKAAMLTIIHKTSQKGTVYPIVQSITPVLEQLLTQVPDSSTFTGVEATPVMAKPSPETANKVLGEAITTTIFENAKTVTTTDAAGNPFDVEEDDVPF